MKPTIVLILKGKGNSDADTVSTRIFNNRIEAENFVSITTDLDKKYWTYAEIVSDGEEIETHYSNFGIDGRF
jgi:hypothetical protein